MKNLSYNEVVGFVTTNKLYRNPGITLNRLSQLLEEDVDCLGSTIQEGCGKRFQDLLTELRIKEASEMLGQEAYNSFSVEAIGRMAGFENRLLFRSMFKDRTGYSPSEYQRIRLHTC